jgi:hypothetical protein
MAVSALSKHQNRADRNDKQAVRDALYTYFEKFLDLETSPPPEWSR